MPAPLNPCQIAMRLRLGLPGLATRARAIALCERLASCLETPSARANILANASKNSLFVQYPPLAAWLHESLAPDGRGLVHVDVEYVEGSDAVFCVGLVDPNGLRSLMREESLASLSGLSGHWLMRATRWMGTRLFGKSVVESAVKKAHSEAALEHERQAHAYVRIQALLAVALQVVEDFRDHTPRCWLVCPGSPASPVEVFAPRLLEMKDETIACSIPA